MPCRQQRNRLLSVLHVRIQTVFVRWDPTIAAFFLCLFLNDDERLDPDTTISGPSLVRQRNAMRQMAFLLRADAAGPSLNARMTTVIFQGIRTRIAEKPYIFMIFRGGGGVWIRGCSMAANLLASVHFSLLLPLYSGLALLCCSQ